MNQFEYNFDTKEVENEITDFIIEVIRNVDENIIFNLLREQEYVDVEIPKMEIGNYTVNPFVAHVPREKVEEILFNV